MTFLFRSSSALPPLALGVLLLGTGLVLGGVQPSAAYAQEVQAQEDLPAEAPASNPVMMNVDSQTFRYNEDNGHMVATGLVRIVIEEQNSELLADKVTYNPDEEVLIAEGNVRIIRAGEITDGSYARISLNRQSALINDTTTQIGTIRVKAKQAYVDNDYIELENGQLLLDMDGLTTALTQRNQARMDDPSNQLDGVQAKAALRTGFQPYFLNSKRVLNFAEGPVEASAQATPGSLPQAEPKEFLSFYRDQGLDVDSGLFNSSNEGLFGFKTKELDVTQYPDGYQELDLRWPKLTVKNVPVLTYPSIDVGLDKTSGRFDYLGPEVGFNPDLGGLYAGPGWDFRLAKGVAKVSPLLSYGQGIDRSGGSFSEDSSSLGVGLSAQYQDDKTQLEFARVSQNEYNVFYGERRLFDGNTRLLLSGNRDLGGSLIGLERPAYSAQVDDRRQLIRNEKLSLLSYASVGVFEDEFNPTNDGSFFVQATSTDPERAGRLLLQLQANNTKPLLQLGNNVELGWQGQMSLAGYSTGDHQAVLRAGPTANVTLGDRFLSQAIYSIGGISGQSPFVFDTYFLGKQAVTLNNVFKVNRFLSVGARNDLSLLRDNALNELLVGNTLFASFGPKDFKFNVGFDFIRQRSYFGVNFYPGSGTGSIDYERARIFQPLTY